MHACAALPFMCITASCFAKQANNLLLLSMHTHANAIMLCLQSAVQHTFARFVPAMLCMLAPELVKHPLHYFVLACFVDVHTEAKLHAAHSAVPARKLGDNVPMAYTTFCCKWMETRMMRLSSGLPAGNRLLMFRLMTMTSTLTQMLIMVTVSR